MDEEKNDDEFSHDSVVFPALLFRSSFSSPTFSIAPVWLGGGVVRRWKSDQQVAGSTPGLRLIGCDPREIVDTHVPLLPSSIIWYRRKLGR